VLDDEMGRIRAYVLNRELIVALFEKEKGNNF